MKSIFLAAAVCVLVIAAAGCASIVSGSKQEIGIDSKPDQAEVRIYNQSNIEIWNSKTPATVRLNRGDGFFEGAEYRVEISKEGFETKTLTITSSLNGGWYIAGNFFIGGFLGWLIIDPASGAMWKLEPDSIHVTLEEKLAAGNGEIEEGFAVILRDDIADEDFESLRLERIQ